ncbi:MAG TPA: class IV adenylate cyclase [Thermomicrobiaceae bacterium]|nr:class IV adenylate cyclase [Thermomicrobiaceae bacterium]
MRNLELKVPLPALSAARERARMLGAEPAGVQEQTDAYFDVPHGRLKLRRIAGQREATLIAYRRPDEAASRYSDYLLAPAAEPDALGEVLVRALGVLVVVRKRRELWRFGATRIHLDEVEGLGSFVELETVLGGQPVEAAEAEHRLVRDRLGLADLLPIPGSYGDLLLALRER